MLDAFSVNSVGPGFSPLMQSTPIAIAAMVSPEMPNSNDGTQPEAIRALLLAPASTRPSTWPVPNFSGSLENRFDIAYETQAAMSAPAPGSTPIMMPTMSPRVICQ